MLGYLSQDHTGHLSGFDAEYHAFWRDLFGGRTLFISDPVTGGSPVGVDCELSFSAQGKCYNFFDSTHLTFFNMPSDSL